MGPNNSLGSREQKNQPHRNTEKVFEWNSLLHQRIPRRNITHDRRFNLQFLLTNVPTNDNVPLRFRKHALQPLEVSLIDHTTK